MRHDFSLSLEVFLLVAQQNGRRKYSIPFEKNPFRSIA
jgi:hypothetical protein